MSKKPFNRVLGGSGTYADPLVVRNDMAFELDRIPESGYDYELGRIANIRKLFEQTEMNEEQRANFACRIDTKELRCRAMRPRYLLRRATEVEKDNRLDKVKVFRQNAKDAYSAFKKFAEEHRELTDEHKVNSVWSKFLQPIQELE